MQRPPRIAYLIDPRFPGGTSAAVAMELRETARMGQVHVHAVKSGMFSGTTPAPVLAQALAELNLPMTWDDRRIEADVVIVHNPSFLKRQKELRTQIVARQMIAVAHENFLRPGGIETFDVRHCLNLLARSSLVLQRMIAPISQGNRLTIQDWLAQNPLPQWSVLGDNWFNICEFDMTPPVPAPADRRGRHSRPGIEKFPDIGIMDESFPPYAQKNVILGGDVFLKREVVRPHWQVHPFRGLELKEYFGQIDFMIYYTAKTWHESFGRVIAESIAAGKIVITDDELAESFPEAVVAARPRDVDKVIAKYIEQPDRYRAHVTASQDWLRQFSGTAFRQRFRSITARPTGAPE